MSKIAVFELKSVTKTFRWARLLKKILRQPQYGRFKFMHAVYYTGERMEVRTSKFFSENPICTWTQYWIWAVAVGILNQTGGLAFFWSSPPEKKLNIHSTIWKKW